MADRNKVSIAFVAKEGKGSHGTVYYGSNFTALKDRKKELGAGLLHKMCKDLDINPRDLR